MEQETIENVENANGQEVKPAMQPDINQKIYEDPDPDLRSYFEKTLPDYAEDIEIIAYRVIKQHRRKRRLFLKRFDYIPGEEELGELFGGGEYWLKADFVGQADNEIIAKTIYLDSSFNKPLDVPTNDQQDTIISSLVKMVEEKNKPKNEFGAVEQMGEVMIGMLQKVGNAVVDKTLDKLDPPVPALPEVEPTQDQYNIVKDVIGIIKEWGPKILKMPQAGIDLGIKPIIDGSEQMQAAKADPQLASIIYSAGCEEPEIGPDKMGALMKKLGFELEQ